MKNIITEILGHDVSWNLGKNRVLSETNIEYIENSIKDGISQGELSDDKNSGWWHIINWRDIANELYNNCPEQTMGQIQARNRFNKEWTF